MAPANTNPSPKSVKHGGSDQNSFGAYLRDVASHAVMSPETELAAARDIAAGRRKYWKALLSYPPFADGIAGLVEQVLDGESVPAGELITLRKSSRRFRDRETKTNRERFEADRDSLATALAAVDVDGVASDRVAADLETIHAGQRQGLSMHVTCPPKGSRPFAAYVQRVRAAATGLRVRKHRFVKSNLRLVISIARRYDHGLMSLHDLTQEGNIGLMKAVDRFDPERGFRFSTYASWWIRHSINRALANKGRMVRLPAHVSADQHKLTRARRELEARHGRPATDAELAKHTGLPTVRVTKLKKVIMQPVLSLDVPVGEDDARTAMDMLMDPESTAPAEQLEVDALTNELHDAFDELQPMEIDILRKRFSLDGDEDPLTLRELGERHSLSRERIRQLQERALGKLRKHFAGRDLL
jgi:RNA polymerase primary sigma factor